MARRYKKYKRNKYRRYRPTTEDGVELVKFERGEESHGRWIERESSETDIGGFDQHLSALPFHYHKKDQLLNILLILAFVAGAGLFTQIRTDSPLPSPEYP